MAFSIFAGGYAGHTTARTTPSATTSSFIGSVAISEDFPPLVTTTKPLTARDTVKEYFADVPMLIDVARCESQFRHFDKNGRVLRGVINKGDIGVMQINEYYHAKEAKKLGFDLYSMEGNMAYARSLYEREGLTPWLPSSKCWKGNELALR